MLQDEAHEHVIERCVGERQVEQIGVTPLHSRPGGLGCHSGAGLHEGAVCNVDRDEVRPGQYSRSFTSWRGGVDVGAGNDGDVGVVGEQAV